MKTQKVIANDAITFLFVFRLGHGNVRIRLRLPKSAPSLLLFLFYAILFHDKRLLLRRVIIGEFV